MMYTCSAYGMGLQVNVPIAALRGLAAAPRVDVVVSLGAMPPVLEKIHPTAIEAYHASPHLGADNTPLLKVSRLAEGQFFKFDYADGTTFVIESKGEAIWATWRPSATVEDTATYLLGPILGFVLRLRGITCLHASAVAIDEKAIALIGPSGAGKSTTAAAFAELGYPVLSDDVVPLYTRGTAFDVQPAYPRVRLWPAAAIGLFGSEDALPRITPGWDKRFLDLAGSASRFQANGLPLGAIYVLAGRSAASTNAQIEPLTVREAFLELIANTYANNLLSPALRAQEFDVLGRVLEKVPVRLIRPSSDFASIWQLCKLIDADVRQTAKASSMLSDHVAV